jgi:hypothetical protein
MRAEMSQVILVVGMHRSGTTALTEVLVRAGAWFGDAALAAGGRPRPLGLLERTDFLSLTEPALRAVGCRWHDVVDFQPSWNEPYARSVQQAFATSVLADLLAHPVAVLKDPRLCFLLPLFLPMLPKTAVAVMIVRDPLEVAMSLAVRNGFSISFGVALWEAYNRQALISLRGVPSILVSHRRLLREPKTSISDLVRRLAGLGADGLSAQAAIAPASIEASLQHHHAEDEQRRGLARAQRSLWKKLRNAAAPADVPIGTLSEESGELLRAHHANPILPRTRAATEPTSW